MPQPTQLALQRQLVEGILNHLVDWQRRVEAVQNRATKCMLTTPERRSLSLDLDALADEVEQQIAATVVVDGEYARGLSIALRVMLMEIVDVQTNLHV